MGLHGASPQHLVEEMTGRHCARIGLGPADFRADLADPDKLAAVLQQEAQGRRDICMYARESHVLVAKSPAELFIDPSHTYRWRLNPDDAGADPPPTGFLRVK